jgi:hypothetical protein
MIDSCPSQVLLFMFPAIRVREKSIILVLKEEVEI